MVKLNQKLLNKEWTKATGMSVHGVKLGTKIDLVLRRAGLDLPRSKLHRKMLAAALLAGKDVKAVAAQLSQPDQAVSAAPREKVSQKKSKRDGFYASWEWKKARYEALRSCGHRCMSCGWQPGDTEQGHLVVDHIKPRRRYPELALEVSNLQALCNDCNMGKSNVYEDDFRSMDDAFRTMTQH